MGSGSSLKKEKVMKKILLLSLFLVPFTALSDEITESSDVLLDVPVATSEYLDVVDSKDISSNTSDRMPDGVVNDVSSDVDGSNTTLTPEKDSITQDDVNLIVQAIKEENWMLLVGLILTLLVLVLDKWINIKQWVGEKGLPWVAASLGIVTHIGLALSTGTGWLTAIITGLLSGASAVGLWNLLGSKKQS